MQESLLDFLVYRNIFDVTELALDLVNINIADKDKRLRIKQSFLIITRRQKNRIITGLAYVDPDKRLPFIIGCFKENSDLIKKRVAIVGDISVDVRKNAYEEIDKFTEEKIAYVSEVWKEKALDLLSQKQILQEISNWRTWK
jgi:hypothetical protein